jgi:hypothetical protein
VTRLARLIDRSITGHSTALPNLRDCPTSGHPRSFSQCDTGVMVDDAAKERAIYQALKAVDEVAAALQAHLVEEHQATPSRGGPPDGSTSALKLLHQARVRLGEGLRVIEADTIHLSDGVSLRNTDPEKAV